MQQLVEEGLGFVEVDFRLLVDFPALPGSEVVFVPQVEELVVRWLEYLLCQGDQ